ncbi:MAG: hypothetical protein O4861_11345 [Trichodesmium sp. St16_bin4-tuft]|nr:hypothetical protein [Trichodesmium sp. St4_bin8_1]MDE5072886.1 hypothetical protein [Trichodesmium sp. St5_bin8]MDE5077301.1 hypothetical protein [Trichodesmium sp. St2_bin6]MDE5098892.1 hypothetical protein [Trichodesmium sp. St16_bin4-tuft]MDE5104496.1 hypothetical protein [Trichodesmium sp. St19_bin2]
MSKSKSNSKLSYRLKNLSEYDASLKQGESVTFLLDSRSDSGVAQLDKNWR